MSVCLSKKVAPRNSAYVFIRTVLVVEKYFFAQTITNSTCGTGAFRHCSTLVANIIYSRIICILLVLDYELVVYMHVLPTLVCIMHTFRSSKIGIRPGLACGGGCDITTPLSIQYVCIGCLHVKGATDTSQAALCGVRPVSYTHLTLPTILRV